MISGDMTYITYIDNIQNSIVLDFANYYISSKRIVIKSLKDNFFVLKPIIINF